MVYTIDDNKVLAPFTTRGFNKLPVIQKTECNFCGFSFVKFST